MSPPARRDDDRMLIEKVDKLVESFASMKTAQELHRSDALEKHIQNRTDIHNLRDGFQSFLDRLAALKEDIRDLISEERDNQRAEMKEIADKQREEMKLVAAEIKASNIAQAKTKLTHDIVKAALLAVVVALLTAFVQHFVPGAKP